MWGQYGRRMWGQYGRPFGVGQRPKRSTVATEDRGILACVCHRDQSTLEPLQHDIIDQLK